MNLNTPFQTSSGTWCQWLLFIIHFLTQTPYNILQAVDGMWPELHLIHIEPSLIAKIMGPTWGPPGADRTQVGSMLAPWTLLFGMFCSFTYLSDVRMEAEKQMMNRLFVFLLSWILCFGIVSNYDVCVNFIVTKMRYYKRHTYFMNIIRIVIHWLVQDWQDIMFIMTFYHNFKVNNIGYSYDYSIHIKI